MSLGSTRMRLPRRSVRSAQLASSATTHSPLSPYTTIVTALKVGRTGSLYFISNVLLVCVCVYVHTCKYYSKAHGEFFGRKFKRLMQHTADFVVFLK